MTQGHEGIFAPARRGVSVERMAPLALFVLWAFCNPYFEVGASSLIYTGRAIADLDPAGVGRDIMFRLDGQSGFTVFTVLYRTITAALGPATATLVVSSAALVAGFGGAMVFAACLGTRRTRYLAVAFAAALPAFYGGFKIFSYAEVSATPRPFAEALVLCAMAGIVRGRFGLAALACAAAFVLHPIMALPGVGVLYLSLVVDDRRWLALLPVAGLVLAALAAVDPAFAHWLATPMDAAWKAVLAEHSPHLFPAFWPDGWIGRASARIATLVVAATLSPRPLRRLFVVAILVGLTGLALSYLSGYLPSAILVQMQCWRAMWLVFSLATAAAAICVVELWARPGMSRVVLMLLALSWICGDQIGLMFAISALGLVFVLEANEIKAPPYLVGAILVVLATLAAAGLVLSELATAWGLGDVPAGQGAEARAALSLDWDYTPLAVLAAICMSTRRIRIAPATLAVLIVGGLAALVATWDRRGLETRYFDAGAGAPDLTRMMAGADGDVFWIGGVRETWSWLARPQWLSPIQGAGIVFSRELALLYQARTRRAVAAGLATTSAGPDLSEPAAAAGVAQRFGGVPGFCALDDAPAWIVAPLRDGEAIPAGLEAARWTSPIPRLVPVDDHGLLSWRMIARYAVIRCRRPPASAAAGGNGP